MRQRIAYSFSDNIYQISNQSGHMPLSQRFAKPPPPPRPPATPKKGEKRINGCATLTEGGGGLQTAMEGFTAITDLHSQTSLLFASTPNPSKTSSAAK